MKQLHLKIYGRVQGVFYRENTKNQARQLGLVGWVKNCLDGTVELLAQGEDKNLQKLAEWCKNGPKHAGVEKVEEEWGDMDRKFSDFKITY